MSVRLSVCVTFVVFTDCESCTRPISTNPGSMEASVYGLTRGTCFVARRLEVVAVAGLLWISLCVLGMADFFAFSFVTFFLFSFERTRSAASMRPLCLLFRSTGNEARPRDRSDLGLFLPAGKRASSYRGAYRVPLFNLSVCLSVCVCTVCVTIVVLIDCESCARPISTKPGSMETGEYGLTRGTRFVARRLEVVAVAGLLWIAWCVLGAAGYVVFFVFQIILFSSNSHGLLQV